MVDFVNCFNFQAVLEEVFRLLNFTLEVMLEYNYERIGSKKCEVSKVKVLIRQQNLTMSVRSYIIGSLLLCMQHFMFFAPFALLPCFFKTLN